MKSECYGVAQLPVRITCCNVTPDVSHKFSETFSGVSLPETFHSVSHGSSCPGEDGQYDNGGAFHSTIQSA